MKENINLLNNLFNFDEIIYVITERTFILRKLMILAYMNK